MKMFCNALGALLLLLPALAMGQTYPSPKLNGANITGVPALATIESQFAEPLAAGTGLKIRLLATASDPAGTLIDSSGLGNNVVYSGAASPPTHNADGSVAWNGANSAVPLPNGVTGLASIDVVINQAIETPQALGMIPAPATNTIFGPASGNGFLLQLTQNYGGTSTGQGYALAHLKLYQFNGGTQFFGGPGIDNGLEFYHVSFTPGGTVASVMQNGTLLPQDKAAVAYSAISSTWVPALGGNPQSSNPTNVQGTFTLEYLAATTTQETTAQTVQDYHAEQALMAYKGVVSNPAYGPTDVNNIAYTFAESTGSAYQLGNPPTNNYFGTQNFTYLSMGILNAAYGTATETIGANTYPAGDSWQNITNGNNDATGYTMMEPCATQLNAVGMNATGYREALFWSHGNSLGPADGTYGSGVNFWPAPNNDISAASQTMGDLNGFNECMAKTGGRWTPIVGTIIGGPSGATYANHQAIANPLIRIYAAAHGWLVFDAANDIRFGINQGTGPQQGAGYYTGTACTLPGGTAGSSYVSSDHNHPSLCGQTILANMFAAVSADAKQRNAPRIATVAANYTMGLPDIEGTLTVPGGGTLNLMPCGGLYNAKMATITNSGSANEIIQAGTEYDGGANDNIVSAGVASPTYQLLPGATHTFKVAFPTGTDGTTAGVCQVNVGA